MSFSPSRLPTLAGPSHMAFRFRDLQVPRRPQYPDPSIDCTAGAAELKNECSLVKCVILLAWLLQGFRKRDKPRQYEASSAPNFTHPHKLDPFSSSQRSLLGSLDLKYAGSNPPSHRRGNFCSGPRSFFQFRGAIPKRLRCGVC